MGRITRFIVHVLTNLVCRIQRGVQYYAVEYRKTIAQVFKVSVLTPNYVLVSFWSILGLILIFTDIFFKFRINDNIVSRMKPK